MEKNKLLEYISSIPGIKNRNSDFQIDYNNLGNGKKVDYLILTDSRGSSDIQGYSWVNYLIQSFNKKYSLLHFDNKTNRTHLLLHVSKFSEYLSTGKNG